MTHQTELKISIKDWVYITFIASLFGFFISFLFYYIEDNFRDISTVFFGTVSAMSISLASSFFITISNNFILPHTSEKFWYIISFMFSFISGVLGFLVSFNIFFFFEISIIEVIKPFWLHITILSGFLTFLIGFILHQFISHRYKIQLIKSKLLENKILALENELNPHFLFNALNSISELIHIDTQKAEDSISHLSQFLRNAITKKSLISLQDEVEMVKTYVAIENIRFKNKIKLTITDDLPNIKIPKFSIQLLVENAIKHGLTSSNLEIKINVKENKIIISNNGKKPQNIKFGIGLTNLNNRLELLDIGSLNYNIEDEMIFNIQLKDIK